MKKIRIKRIILMSLIILSMGFAPSTIIKLNIIDKVAIASDNKDIVEDNINPVVDYAYVENGILKLSISDNEALSRKPIIYRIDKEFRSYEIDIRDYVDEYDGNRRVGRVYEIDIEIPSTIFITVKDFAGNESSYKFTIKEDNVALTKYIPEFVLERLADIRRSKVNKFKGFDDILELEYGKVVDAFSLYDSIIKDNYYKYNKNDIRFKISGLSSDRDGNIKLNKYGIFKVTMTHTKDKTFEETAYILIKPNWKNTDERKTPNSFSPYIVYKDKIKVADYFRYDDEINTKKGKSKIDTTYMLVHNEETGKTVGMNDQINLELNKIYRLNVLNFENNSQQDFYIMRQEKAKSVNRNFVDVDRAYWANKYINPLVSKGILSGYPDGSFKPEGNITVKEFMTILSRQIATTPIKGKSVVGDVMVPFSTDSWGYIESKSILDRIGTRNLRRFDYVDMDRPINRGEVAFLINNVLILDTPYNTGEYRPLKDVNSSPYSSDIKNLVDLGIISGYPDGSFKPNNSITRAEIAALFNRIK